MDERIRKQQETIKTYIDYGVDIAFRQAQGLLKIQNGDISPEQNSKLDGVKHALLNSINEHLESNLPEIPLSKEEIMAKVKKKTFFTIDYFDLEQIIKKAYGYQYEIVAEEEKNNDSTINVDVGPDEDYEPADIERVRTKHPGQYFTSDIMQALYLDGYLEAGEYQIEISW